MIEYTDHWWHVYNPACEEDKPHNSHPFIDHHFDDNWCAGLCSCLCTCIEHGGLPHSPGAHK